MGIQSSAKMNFKSQSLRSDIIHSNTLPISINNASINNSNVSSSTTKPRFRYIRRNKTSKSNVRSQGFLAQKGHKMVYHKLIDRAWPILLFELFLLYTSIYFIFAAIYYFANLAYIDTANSNILSFYESNYFVLCFNFVVQTGTSIGYGFILPKNIHFIASFLTMFLLVYVTEMFDTLFIGLLMAKIKKPTRLQTQLRFSSNAVINDGYSTTKYVAKSVINSSLKFQSKYERHQHSDFNFESGTIHDVGSYAKSAINNQFKVLMSRFVHVRPASRMCMPSMNVLLYPNNEELDYEIYKKHGRLRSARNDIPMISLHWTVVHKIDQNSPLFGLSKEQMIKKRLKLLSLLEELMKSQAIIFKNGTALRQKKFFGILSLSQ